MKICEGCKRHIREEVCPFCGGSASRSVTPRSGNLSHVSRARLIAGAAALGAAGAVVDLGCAAGSPSPSPQEDSGGAVPVYGAPASDGGGDAVAEGGPGTLYGLPPIEEDSGANAPAYGAPAK